MLLQSVPASELRRRLVAILLNPPSGTGRSTTRHLAVAAHILGNMELAVVNLFATATKSIVEVNDVGRAPEGWLAARPGIRSAIGAADEVLVGWGIGGIHGAARQCMRRQIDWLINALPERLDAVWTIGGEPRHPSRWHQYVSDKHGRTEGGSFEQRLRAVLARRDRAWVAAVSAGHAVPARSVIATGPDE